MGKHKLNLVPYILKTITGLVLVNILCTGQQRYYLSRPCSVCDQTNMAHQLSTYCMPLWNASTSTLSPLDAILLTEAQSRSQSPRVLALTNRHVGPGNEIDQGTHWPCMRSVTGTPIHRILIPELCVLALTKRHVGSGNEIGVCLLLQIFKVNELNHAVFA